MKQTIPLLRKKKKNHIPTQIHCLLPLHPSSSPPLPLSPLGQSLSHKGGLTIMQQHPLPSPFLPLLIPRHSHSYAHPKTPKHTQKHPQTHLNTDWPWLHTFTAGSDSQINTMLITPPSCYYFSQKGLTHFLVTFIHSGQTIVNLFKKTTISPLFLSLVSLAFTPKVAAKCAIILCRVNTRQAV